MKKKPGSRFRNRIVAVGAVVSAAALVFCGLASCGNALDPAAQLRLSDTIAPTIVVNTPAQGSSYAASVVVEGSVSDAADSEGHGGEVSRIEYSVIGATIGEVVSVTDSDFEFAFSAAALSGTITVRITAEDWNGNVSALDLTLVEGESQIPSFHVSGTASRIATLEWDPVPLSTSYTLYYTDDGTSPGEGSGIEVMGVVSPHEVVGLENGYEYQFVLRSISSQGEDNWSSVHIAVPVSETTLSPLSYSESGSVNLVWKDIPGADTYDVLRSAGQNGPFASIASAVADNSYSDTNVTMGSGYWYKIRISDNADSESFPVWGISSDFATPALIGTLLSVTNTWDLKVDGDYAYLPSNNGVYIVDVSDPTSPSLVTTVGLGTTDVAILGSYAYSATSTAVQVIDISTPGSASVDHTIAVSGTIESVGQSGDYLYVATAEYTTEWIYSVHVVDISSPLTAGIDHTVTTVERVNDIEVYGNFAYLVEGTSGLHVMDVSAPLSAAIVESFATDGNAVAIALDGTYAYIAEEVVGLQIVDISVPTNVSAVRILATGNAVQGVTVVGDRAYVGDNDLVVLDISDPTDPIPLDTLNLPGEPMKKVAVVGDLVFATGYSHLLVVALPSASFAEVVHSLPTDDQARGVTVAGSYAYVADGTAGLQVVDITVPNAATIVDTLDLGTRAMRVAVLGDFAFVVCYDTVDSGLSGLYVVDVSTPTDVKLLHHLPAGDLQDLALFGDYAFAAERNDGAVVIDISSPATASVAHTVTMNSGCDAIALWDGYLYAGGSSDGDHIVDISTPASASIVKTVSAVNSAGVAVAGGYAYLAHYDSMKIVDVDPVASAGVIKSVDTEVVPGLIGYALGSDVAGTLAFISDIDSGLNIIDVSSPANAELVIRLPTSADTWDAAVSGRWVYYADGSGGLKVGDLWPFE